MEKAKRVWIGLLTVLCTFCCIGVVACGGSNEGSNGSSGGNEDSHEQATAAEYLTFTLKKDDTYEITAKDKNNLPQSVALPSSYKGKPVTSIGASAFYNCSSLTGIEIPDAVTSIGEEAFRGCSSLTGVVIGNSVTSIGEGAFFNCSSLTSATIGNSVTNIGEYAFYNCINLTSVTFENPNGWRRFYSSTATSGTSISDSDLADSSTAARYLTLTYDDYYWKRSE